ncbi:MAG: carotenoid biosynthesis protein, partial [Schleiferiaceae bacterium]
MNDLGKIQVLAAKYGGYVLIFFHTIGLFLLGAEWRHDFVFLTPYNLLLMLVVFLLASDRPKNWTLYMAPIVLGFIIEVIGTNTGWPFGAYTYGTALGPRVLSTPLMIGVLWWVLIRAWFDLSGRWTQNAWAKALITGTAMVLMDVMIEPVAIELDFWNWAEVEVPVANYISWFVL